MNQRLLISHRPFGGWSWELLDERGAVAAESWQEFGSREECGADARMHAAILRTRVGERHRVAELATAE